MGLSTGGEDILVILAGAWRAFDNGGGQQEHIVEQCPAGQKNQGVSNPLHVRGDPPIEQRTGQQPMLALASPLATANDQTGSGHSGIRQNSAATPAEFWRIPLHLRFLAPSLCPVGSQNPFFLLRAR